MEVWDVKTNKFASTKVATGTILKVARLQPELVW